MITERVAFVYQIGIPFLVLVGMAVRRDIIIKQASENPPSIRL